MKVKPANPEACRYCPWRLENAGRPHPHGFYTKGNLARLWIGLRRGASMSCHPTDPRMAVYEGYEDQAGRDQFHECTGALIVAQREYMRFQAITFELEDGSGDALRIYRQRFPGGLAREGLVALFERAAYGGTFLGGLKMSRPDLLDPAVGYPKLRQPTIEEVEGWARV